MFYGPKMRDSDIDVLSSDVLQDLGEDNLPRNFESSWNFCENGHYEEGNSPNHRCINEISARKGLDCE